VAGGATDGVSSYSAGYGLASTRWCRTGKRRPASWTPVHRTKVGPGERRDVAIRITGLMTGRLYCAAIYINGRSTGSVMLEFTAGAPGAELGQATTLSPTSEQLSATVTPALHSTSYRFLWGELQSPWCESYVTHGSTNAPHSTPGVALGTTHRPVRVTTVITGLPPTAGYCWTIVARNSTATTVLPATDRLKRFYAGDPKVTTIGLAGEQTVTQTTVTSQLVGKLDTTNAYTGDIVGVRFVWTNNTSLCSAGFGIVPTTGARDLHLTPLLPLTSVNPTDHTFSTKIQEPNDGRQSCFEALVQLAGPPPRLLAGDPSGDF
jgi:hypothetical protein